MESKKAEIIETESRVVVARDWGKWGEVGQRVETSYKMISSGVYHTVLNIHQGNYS